MESVGDYQVRLGFDKLTRDSKMIENSRALEIPGLVMKRVISSGTKFLPFWIAIRFWLGRDIS